MSVGEIAGLVAAVRPRAWVADFATTDARARRAKHTELMGLLTTTERGRLE
ncbi:hypothetical protein [Propioniciclava soli]|uniref:Uncharacterized protein n=1 Tax=Propioniciclava soli TaxID=2775081 RepID=A0ABZ3C3V0_9ACTN|nr:hypothetical protein [Propioniciclava soli]